MSSPHYPQSNGKIENAVKTAKKLLIKAKASGQDPYLAILDWRNTPSPSIGSSPVQRLFGRRTKTLLLTAGTLSQPKIMEGTEDKLKERKTKQALFYNKETKELPEPQPGDTVRMKPLPSDKEKLWRKGSVVKKVAPRSYEVDLHGTMFRRNRRHLVKTKEPSPEFDLESQENLRASSTPLPVDGPPVMQTRSGRVIHRPG